MKREPIIVGHRGARFEAPENTIAGFQYAVTAGLLAVEFDVRMTADEEIVVIHDNAVDRTTDGSGLVSALSLQELQSLNANAIFPDWPDNCIIPTLDQVLEVVGAMPEITIEIKTDDADRLERLVPMVIDSVVSRGLTEQVTLTSFDPVALLIAKEEGPQLTRGLTGRWDRPGYLDIASDLACHRADVHFKYGDPEIVGLAKSRGMKAMCWTIDSEEDLETALFFDPDFLCTDVPSLIRRLYDMTNRLEVPVSSLFDEGMPANAEIPLQAAVAETLMLQHFDTAH